MDPQTLTRHYLGPEPSHYVSRTIRREEKGELFWDENISSIFPLLFSFSSSFLSLSLFLTSPLFLFSFAEMTTKFNQEFYTRIKAKKNEPLSNIGQRRLRVVEKEKENEVTENGLSTPALDEG